MAKKSKSQAEPQQVRNDARTRARAIRELGIDVPVYTTRVVGDRLELALYGGSVVYWPPEAPAA
jgi:hypothetical protein